MYHEQLTVYLACFPCVYVTLVVTLDNAAAAVRWVRSRG